MAPTDKHSFGGFWIRFAAYFVDVVVMLIPTLLIAFLLRSTLPTDNESQESFVRLIDDFINLMTWWVYTSAFLSSSWQATPGKRICGLKVIDYNGGRISFGQATGRYFAGLLNIFTIFVGYLMIAWTERRQGLHDLIAGTLVVKTASSDIAPASSAQKFQAL